VVLFDEVDAIFKIWDEVIFVEEFFDDLDFGVDVF
jgi:hypothetical protein